MQPWIVASLGCLLASAAALFAGEEALARAHDLVALYWLVTGTVSLRASLALAEK